MPNWLMTGRNWPVLSDEYCPPVHHDSNCTPIWQARKSCPCMLQFLCGAFPFLLTLHLSGAQITVVSPGMWVPIIAYQMPIVDMATVQQPSPRMRQSSCTLISQIACVGKNQALVAALSTGDFCLKPLWWHTPDSFHASFRPSTSFPNFIPFC